MPSVYFSSRFSSDIALCSCTQCPACNCIAYDEEIISGWTNDDANLNTRCPSCNTNFIASLKIKIREKHSETSVPSWYMPLVINIVGEEMSTRSDEHEVSQVMDVSQILDFINLKYFEIYNKFYLLKYF